MPKVKTNHKDNQSGFSALNQFFKNLEEERVKRAKAEEAAYQKRIKEEEKARKKREKEEDERQKRYYEKYTELKAEEERKKAEWAEVNSAAKNVADPQKFTGATIWGAALGIDPAMMSAMSSVWRSTGIGQLGKAVKDKVHDSTLKNQARGIVNDEIEEEKKSGKKSKKSKSNQMGSAVQDAEDSKLVNKLDTIINTLKKNQKKEEKEAKPERESFLSKLLGGIGNFAGKFLLPLLAGLLGHIIKPFIEKLLSKMLSSLLGETGGKMVGGILADILPGAIAGYMIAKKFGGSPLHGAMIGGAISLGYYSIRRAIDKAIDIFNGEGKEITAEGYLESAMRGALIAAGLTKFKSGKAVLLGAGIGIAAEWLLNRMAELKAALSGEEIEIKKVGPFSESMVGAAVGGALIGSKFGGLKGAAWGLLIGTVVGGIETAMVDLNNRLNRARSGEYTEPETICGIPYGIFTGMIAGGAIGFKVGGLPGALIGAACGAAAGAIYDLAMDMKTKRTADQAKIGKMSTEDKDKIIQQSNARLDQLKEKERLGTLTEAEKEEKKKYDTFESDNAKRMEMFHKVDANHDGKVTKEEIKAYREKNMNWKGFNWGSEGRSIRRMEDMLETSADGVSELDMQVRSAQKAKLETINMPKDSQILNTDSEMNRQLIEKNTEAVNNLNTFLADGKTLNQTNILNGVNMDIEPYQNGSVSQVSFAY